MIYQFTGQPGHGKTLSAMALALKFKDEGRLVYACNIRDLDYQKSGFLPMTPEDFINWCEFLPDGCVCFVDEVYEHGMMPKRPPGSRVPHHIEQLAKHRHRGIDFIFVCQSPKHQVDNFAHDLIDQHYHVRRRFGTKWIVVKEFDHYEANPLRAHPLNLKRCELPKRPMGMYVSTELDTTKRNIPWYYIAIPIVLVIVIAMTIYSFYSVKKGLSNDTPEMRAKALAGENGAVAKVEPAKAVAPHQETDKPLSMEEYIARFVPRIDSQPWSAPAYDELPIPQNPPRVFCMSSGEPTNSCRCITDQGTSYEMRYPTCIIIARHGQYEPYLDVVSNNSKQSNAPQQIDYLFDARDQQRRNQYSDAQQLTGSSVIGAKGDPSQVGQPAQNVRGWIKSY